METLSSDFSQGFQGFLKNDDEDQIKGKEREFLVNFAKKFNKALRYRYLTLSINIFIINIFYILNTSL